jgi:hypothetical protein
MTLGRPGFVALLIMSAASAIAQSPPITLNAPQSPQKAVAADGFVQRWLLLEPIPSTGLTDTLYKRPSKRSISRTSRRSFPAMATRSRLEATN